MYVCVSPCAVVCGVFLYHNLTAFLQPCFSQLQMPVVEVDVIAGTVRDPTFMPWRLPQVCGKPNLNECFIIMDQYLEAYLHDFCIVEHF